jgi:glycosyltransferase 2 family protein
MNEGLRRKLASAAVSDPPQTDAAAAPTAGRAARIGKVLRAGVSIGLILLLARMVDWNQLAAVVVRADVALLGLASLTVLADRAMMIGKWYPLLRVQGLDIPFTHAARVYLAASLASLFLPTSVGADLLRTLALGARRRTTLEVGASIVVERMLGLAGSVLLCAVVLVLALSQAFALAFLLPWILGFGCALLGMAFLMLRPGWWRRLEPYRERRWFQLGHRFVLACMLYRHRAGTLAVVGLLSLVEQAFPILVLWILVQALDLEISLFALVVAVPLTLFVGRLPIAIAGIGVLEGALVYLLGVFGVSPTDALSLALAGRFVELVALLPGGLFWSSLVWRRGEPDGAD